MLTKLRGHVRGHVMALKTLDIRLGKLFVINKYKKIGVPFGKENFT